MVAIRTIKQLNEPQPVEVRAGRNGAPEQVRMRAIGSGNGLRRNYSRRRPQELRAIRSDGQWMPVVTVEDRWKINDEWWRGEELEIERLYFDVVLESNQRMTLFHDLVHDRWFKQAE